MRASRMRTDDLMSSVLFCFLDLSGGLMRGSLSVGVEAVKVTDMSKVDVDVLFGIFDVLSVSLVDNDLADEAP